MGFIGELKRRSVFRVGTFYVVTAWVLLQAAELVLGILEVPGQVLKWVLGLLVLGAPVALFLAWAYEWTPDGLKPDSGLDHKHHPSTRFDRRLDFAIIALLVIAVTYFSVDKFALQEGPEATVPVIASEIDRSVAALPFVNHGSDSDSVAFASGIHDDLLTQMTKIAGLRVISNTTMRNYANTTKNIQQIAEELSVRHILEGGVQKAGNRIRINVQLIDATTDSHLWAQTFDRELTVENVFDIQSEIASEITKTLRVALSPETSAMLAQTPTADLEAYKDYVTALAILNRGGWRNATDIRQRIDLLKSAVAKDPQFAMAWAELAMDLRWIETAWGQLYDIDAGIKASEALSRAEEINPDLPVVHRARAYFASREQRFDDALSELDMAETGMPGNADIFRFRYWTLHRMGRFEEAFANIKRAFELNPQEISVITGYGDELTRRRRYDDAREHYGAAIEAQPNVWELRIRLAQIDFFQYGDARPMLEAWSAPDAPRGDPNYDVNLASAYYSIGDIENAVEYVEKATNGLDNLPQQYVPAAEFKAWIFRAAGMNAEAKESAALARQQALDKLKGQPDQPLPILALARMSAFLGDYQKALELAQEGLRIAELNPAFRDKINEGLFRVAYAETLCAAHELSAVEDEWRGILSEENWFTLASLMEWAPYCAEVMHDTAHYRRLKEEFGHLSEGVTARQN